MVWCSKTRQWVLLEFSAARKNGRWLFFPPVAVTRKEEAATSWCRRNKSPDDMVVAWQSRWKKIEGGRLQHRRKTASRRRRNCRHEEQRSFNHPWWSPVDRKRRRNTAGIRLLLGCGLGKLPAEEGDAKEVSSEMGSRPEVAGKMEGRGKVQVGRKGSSKVSADLGLRCVAVCVTTVKISLRKSN